MTDKFVQKGDVLDHTAGAARTSGLPFVIGDCIAIPITDIANTKVGAVAVTGVHTVVKKTGTAWVQGDSLDYDSVVPGFDKDKATPVSGDVENCAIAAADAASGDATGQVLLTPGTGTAT